MEHLRMASRDLVQDNVEAIGKLFPNCIKEVRTSDGVKLSIDFEVLKQELSNSIIEGRTERYEFNWPGKRAAALLANTPIEATLRPCREESVNFDTTENLYIEGDNLDVLKLLCDNYRGKIKMIYIDPPYNTGDDHIYEDDYSKLDEEYRGLSGDYDNQGNRLRKNLDTSGRFHTDWLNMLYPRLKVAQKLLTDDGVVFISIDECELSNLQKIADEILGASNFVAQLVWAAGRKNDSKYISISHEYILCYAKKLEYLTENKIVWREKKRGLEDIYAQYDFLRKKFGSDNKEIETKLKEWYKALPNGHPAKDHEHYNRVDDNGIFFASDISWPGGGGPKYNVPHPITKKPVKIPSRGWITSEDNMKEWIRLGKVEFGKDEKSVPTLKSYLKDKEYSVPYSVFYLDGRAASKRLATLMGEKVFENPKDEEVISRIIEFVGCKDNDIILDFFSGSGTTAHSVFIASNNIGKKLHFILVQLPEKIEINASTSEKSKKVAQNAIDLLNSLNHPLNICEIGKERIRRAGKKIKEELEAKQKAEQEKAAKEAAEPLLLPNEQLTTNHSPLTTPLDIGFRVLKLDSSNMADVYYRPSELKQGMLNLQEDNVKPGRTAEDLLFQVMLEKDIPLSSKIETEKVAGKTIFNVADGYLLACFDKGVTDDVVTAIAKKQPVHAVFRDAGMATDSTAINFDQIFENYSPDTKRSIL